MSNIIAIISDIHSNLTALKAVVKDIKTQGAGAVFCLGDVIGYGAEPDETVNLVRSVCPETCIIGNHDYALITASGAEEWMNSPDATEALGYQKKNLSDANLEWLKNNQEVITRGTICFCHGSPMSNTQYLFDDHDYRKVFNALEKTPIALTLHGHTHVAALASQNEDGYIDISYPKMIMSETERAYFLDDELNYIINPGSVGQPRDNDPRASYALLDLDEEQVRFRRIEYEIHLTQGRIISAGLPEHNATRLKYGR